MKASYDSKANAISIDLTEVDRWEHCERIGERVNVAIGRGNPVNVELLYPDLGIDEALLGIADRYDLDAEALIGIARAAIAAPNRLVELTLRVTPAA